jgi:hypothetical protein
MKHKTMLAAVLALLLVLSSCKGQEPIDTSEETEDYAYSSVYAISKYGVFYPNGYLGLLCCFDWGLDSEIYLCGDASCLHNDSDCPAFFGSYSNVRCAAEYQDQLYVIRRQDETGAWDILRMDLDGNQQSVLCTLSDENLSISPQSGVFFRNGSMFLTLEYTDWTSDTSYIKSCRVDLSNGKMRDVTPLQELMSADLTAPRLTSETVVAVTDELVVIEKTYLEAGAMSEDEFFASHSPTDDYDAYRQEHLYEQYLVCDHSGENERTLFTSDMGQTVQMSRSSQFLLENKLVIGDDTALYTVDLNDGARQLLWDFESTLNFIGLVDNKLFCTVKTGSDDGSQWKRVYYDCQTGQALDTPCTFGTPKGSYGDRIFGICSEGYFWCTKDDFYADRESGLHLIGLI